MKLSLPKFKTHHILYAFGGAAILAAYLLHKEGTPTAATTPVGGATSAPLAPSTATSSIPTSLSCVKSMLGADGSVSKWANQTGLNYAQMADAIYNGQNGCNNNIDEVRAIYASLKNESDLYKLSDAFGTRMYNPCWFDHPMCALFSTGSRNVDLDTFMDLEFTPDVISSFKNPIYAGTASVCAAPPQCTSLWNQIFCGTA